MNRNCLYCYLPLDAGSDFHEKCSVEFFGTKKPPEMGYSMDQMAELAKNVVERSVAVPGVQPKLSLTVIGEALNNGGSSRLTVVGALGGNYIFKPPSEEFSEMPANEHVTMRMAENVFGIKTVPSSLIRLASGELGYITKRIDRTADGGKLHMLDMFQILEAFNKYKGSMEKIGKAIKAYSVNTLLDLSIFFDLVVFCFLTGNSDMHLKNFSMIHVDGEWKFAPAYDLLNVKIVLPEDMEELALPIDAKRKKLNLSHFARFGEGLGLTQRQVENAFRRIEKAQGPAIDLLEHAFLSEEMKTAYIGLLNARYDILFAKR